MGSGHDHAAGARGNERALLAALGLTGGFMLAEAAAGIGLWMFGHWLFALKHGMWRTRLARAAWRVPVWAWASPVRG